MRKKNLKSIKKVLIREKKTKIYYFAGSLVLYLALVFLASLYNRAPLGDWDSEIHNDKAGYYIYLPATFIHGFNYSDKLEATRAQLSGFKFQDGKLYTKYPLGVAVMVLPFFLAAHLVALIGPWPADGFSAPYFEMTYFASVFYFLLGAFVLLKFLRRRFSLRVSVITLVTVMFATNAYYYTMRESLFSHIYSFFLFAWMLWLADRLWARPDTKKIALAAVVCGLIFIVRPVNIIFLPVLLFLGLSSFSGLKERLRFIFLPKNLLIFSFLFFVTILPQLIYWKYLSGSFLYYSYENEGFIYWKEPMIAEVLFAAKNGLLVYSPAYLLAFTGIFIMIFRKEKDRWLVPAITVVFVYMVSSWHSWHYGCSFGQRSFIDYLPLFSIPIASLLDRLLRQIYPFIMVVVMIMIGYLVYVNISLSTFYPKCFLGEAWEYRVYWYYYHGAKVFPVYQQRDRHQWFDDFETKQGNVFSRGKTREYPRAFSGNHVTSIDTSRQYGDVFLLRLDTLKPAGTLLNVDVNLQAYFDGPPGQAAIVCSIEDSTGVFFYKTVPLDEKTNLKPEKWQKIAARFSMQGRPAKGVMKIYGWRMEGSSLYLDDIQVEISGF